MMHVYSYILTQFCCCRLSNGFNDIYVIFCPKQQETSHAVLAWGSFLTLFEPRLLRMFTIDCPTNKTYVKFGWTW